MTKLQTAVRHLSAYSLLQQLFSHQNKSTKHFMKEIKTNLPDICTVLFPTQEKRTVYNLNLSFQLSFFRRKERSFRVGLFIVSHCAALNQHSSNDFDLRRHSMSSQLVITKSVRFAGDTHLAGTKGIISACSQCLCSLKCSVLSQ